MKNPWWVPAGLEPTSSGAEYCTGTIRHFPQHWCCEQDTGGKVPSGIFHNIGTVSRTPGERYHQAFSTTLALWAGHRGKDTIRHFPQHWCCQQDTGGKAPSGIFHNISTVSRTPGETTLGLDRCIYILTSITWSYS